MPLWARRFYMLRFIATTVLTLLGNALGLIVASLLLPGFEISVMGFLWSVLFFTIAQLILSPFVLSMSIKYVPALRGGIALVSTLVVLFLTTLFTSGVTIAGVTEWVLAPLIIWLTTVLAGVVLPVFIFKKTLEKAKETKRTV
jgi:dipeptide/tripeptide permease